MKTLASLSRVVKRASDTDIKNKNSPQDKRPGLNLFLTEIPLVQREEWKQSRLDSEAEVRGIRPALGSLPLEVVVELHHPAGVLGRQGQEKSEGTQGTPVAQR